MGIDLGTQSVRALVVAGDGAVLGTGSSPLTSHRDGPRHEQDPAQWWEAVSLACRAAMPAGGRVLGVAVDATSGTVLLDGHGPALMYDDTRADADLVNEVGGEVWASLGYRRMQPSWALPKLLWLVKEHGRGRVLHQSDYVNRRLVGHDVPTDLSNALKTGAHLVDEDWPHEVMSALGVPDGTLPPLVRPGTQLGVVCAAAAEATGIPEGTPVFAGMTDGCAAQLGAGALTPGSWNSVLGTTLVIKGVTRELIHDPLGAVYSHRGPDGDWLPGGASSTGSGAIPADAPMEELLAGAAAFEPARTLAYPLVSAGERFPFVAPEARGFVLGDGPDRFAAVLQGIGYVERLCFDYLDLLGAPVDGTLTLTGGTTRSRYWCQLRADILGRPVTLPENAQPALGMAVLAATSRTRPEGASLGGGGAGRRRVAEVAGEMVRMRETIEPRPGRFDGTYLRFVDELTHRGWLPGALAAHAHERTAR